MIGSLVTFGLQYSPDVDPDAAFFGGKGAGLLWMAQQDVPVPPGFIIPVDVWDQYDKKPKSTMKDIAKVLPEYLDRLKAHFGYLPLLSVRSGSRVSCPGMMDTILNVGLDEQTAKEWIDRLGAKCYSNCLHRLVTMYGNVVAGIDRRELESSLTVALTAYTDRTGAAFPAAQEQLLGSIEAVFKSWDNERAISYRKKHQIPREWGTAVVVQAMVFGNLNENSGTGVLFTRNPQTGERKVTGEFLQNAQGEDIVAGIRTPVDLDEMKKGSLLLHDDVVNLALKLEGLKKDVQDIEFTVQDGKLYLLQTRTAKRSAFAALKIALDMAKEHLLTPAEAVMRVTARQFDQAQLPSLDPAFKKEPAFKGIAACPGIVSGKPVFSKEEALSFKGACILVRQETTPDDFSGMEAAVGVVTMVGGMTSHAAVVARSIDRACIVGVGQTVDVFKEADIISIDGSTGAIWFEAVPIMASEENGLIEDFKGLVATVTGTVPVLTSVPKAKLPEALFYVGSLVYSPEAAVRAIRETLKLVKKLYVDLTPIPDGAEAAYAALFNTYDAAKAFIAALDDATTAAETKRIVIVGDFETIPPHHFKVLPSGTDLRTLVMAEGEILMGGPSITDPAIQKVLLWKKTTEGITFVSLGEKVEGAKIMMSVQQALQLVGV